LVFENEVVVRPGDQRLLGTVCLDIAETR